MVNAWRDLAILLFSLFFTKKIQFLIKKTYFFEILRKTEDKKIILNYKLIGYNQGAGREKIGGAIVFCYAIFFKRANTRGI